jgi:hypothetical protein
MRYLGAGIEVGGMGEIQEGVSEGDYYRFR